MLERLQTWIWSELQQNLDDDCYYLIKLNESFVGKTDFEVQTTFVFHCLQL